ncbi:UDP-glucose 4-epimerase [Aerococcus viridans]|nr:UDP-glucose 4-epimerase [Aerococcus viridans]
MSKTVLVTGAAGFVAAFLSKELLENGHKVVGVDNINDYYDIRLKEERLKMLEDFELFTFIKMDISDKEAVQ